MIYARVFPLIRLLSQFRPFAATATRTAVNWHYILGLHEKCHTSAAIAVTLELEGLPLGSVLPVGRTTLAALAPWSKLNDAMAPRL